MARLGAGDNVGFQIAFNTGFAMAFVIALYVMFYIKERVSRAKLLQLVSGVNKLIFWLTSFVIDYAIFILISIVYMLVLWAYQEDGYTKFDELGRNFLLLLIFGLASLPFTYLLSSTFKVPSTGLVRLSIFFIISGVFAFMAYFLLSNEIFNLEYIADPLGWIFLLFPHYSLARGLSNINVMQSRINFCDQQCEFLPLCRQDGLKGLCKAVDDLGLNCTNPLPDIRFICTLRNSCCENDFYTFRKDGLLIHFTALLVIFVVSFFLLFAIEYRWLQNLYFKIRKNKR
jgi:ATP-binding cassette, subfamily A (ABC1), member 3